MAVAVGSLGAFTSMRRGFGLRCPHCGEGKIFRAPLKLVDRCSVCNEKLGDIRADDVPAYFTILLVGHLVIVPLLCLSFILTWPLAAVLPLSLALVLVSTLALLPLVKGAFIGVQWATRATAVQ